MTGSAQMRLINRVTKNKPFVKASRIANILWHGQQIISRRRAEQTTLALEHELRMCEIRRCLPSLRDIEAK